MKAQYQGEGHSMLKKNWSTGLSDPRSAWKYPGSSLASSKFLDTYQSWNTEVSHESPSLLGQTFTKVC